MKTVADVEDVHKKELERIRQEHATALENAAKELAAASTKHASTVDQLKADHSTALDALTQELESTRGIHENTITEKDGTHTKAVDELTTELTALKATHEETSTQLTAVQAELAKTKETLAETTESATAYRVKVDELELKLTAATDSAVEAVNASGGQLAQMKTDLEETQAKLQALEGTHSAALEQHIKEIDAREAELNGRSNVISSLRDELRVIQFQFLTPEYGCFKRRRIQRRARRINQ